MKDPWTVLGVSRGADAPTLKTAFRKLALRWHPDHNPGDPTAETRFREILAAYERLTAPGLPPPQTATAPDAPPLASRRSMLRPGVVVAICRTCDGHGEALLSTGFFERIGECPACEGVGLVVDPLGRAPTKTIGERASTPSIRVASSTAPVRALPHAPGTRSSDC